MVVLEDGPVIVEDGEAGSRLDVEVVGGAGVVVVVDDGREEEGEHLQVRQPVLEPGLRDEPVGGLQHVAGVQVVVVRVPVPRVPDLKVGEQRLQDRGRDLVLVEAAVFLQQVVALKATQKSK